ncbi:hypothetical protein Y59_10940 [Enterobacter hormaechei]|nr:putative membrane protein [Enterobacter hormaechei]KAF0681021.1 hypothetical protein Y59_10940 [Enterobacter hormaechei]
MISHEFFLYMAYYVGLHFHAGILFWFYDPFLPLNVISV